MWTVCVMGLVADPLRDILNQIWYGSRSIRINQMDQRPGGTSLGPSE